MKKLFFPFAILFAFILIAGCSTKFNVAAPYKNITVVYGFLDQADTAHYIRIQKAFLDQNKSALTMSQTPDSSFYANLNVKIKRINATGGSAIGDTIHLSRVDLDLEGYPKQPGVFFTSPNYAYKFTNLTNNTGSLDPNYVYRLEITNLTTGEVDSADAAVIVDNDPKVFAVQYFDDSTSIANGIDFATTGNNATVLIHGQYGYNGNGNPLGTMPIPVAIIQSVLRFNWYDSNYVTKTLTPNYYDYNMGYTTLGISYNFEYKPLNQEFYDALLAGMGNAPQNTVRLLDKCNLSIYLSTSDFVSYQNATATQGLGLTGTDIEPVYTNIKGANAIGLYTSRGVQSGTLKISSDCVDSLILSPYMAAARIVGTIY